MWAVTIQGPKKTIGYCFENNGFYCSLNPRGHLEKSDQLGGELKIQDSSTGSDTLSSSETTKPGNQAPGSHRKEDERRIPCFGRKNCPPDAKPWDRSHEFPWWHKSRQGHAKNVTQFQTRYLQCPVGLNDRGPSGKRPDWETWVRV